MPNSKVDIALMFGGRSAEHEVSLLSARSIYEAFDKSKYNIYPLAITKNGYFRSLKHSKDILSGNFKKVPEVKRNNILSKNILEFLEKEIELVFPVLHGPYGEDGKLQGFLDTLDIKYVGCDLSSSAVGMDKAFMKKIFAYHNLPQSNFTILRKEEYQASDNNTLFNKITEEIETPFFVKPANMGSSIGISKVNSLSSFKKALEEAFKYDQKLVLESSINAREIESAVLGNNNNITVSAAGEIISHHDFYDYQAKYEDQSTELIIPAEISEESRKKIKELSIKAFKAVDAEGISRLDFFVDDKKGKVLINEINTMPGFTKFSMYPLLFKEIGIKYSQLLDKLVKLALERYR